MQRVALIYGGAAQSNNYYNSPYVYKSSLEQYNSSPYMNGNMYNNPTHLSGIVKRNKYLLDHSASS